MKLVREQLNEQVVDLFARSRNNGFDTYLPRCKLTFQHRRESEYRLLQAVESFFGGNDLTLPASLGEVQPAKPPTPAEYGAQWRK